MELIVINHALLYVPKVNMERTVQTDVLKNVQMDNMLINFWIYVYQLVILVEVSLRIGQQIDVFQYVLHYHYYLLKTLQDHVYHFVNLDGMV